MNVFKLVLFLAGLAAYLVVRQLTQTAPATDMLPGGSPAAAPGKAVRPPSSRINPAPSLQPHENMLRPEAEYVSQPLPADARADTRAK